MGDTRYHVAKEFAGKAVYLSEGESWVREPEKARVFLSPRDAAYSASFHKDAIVIAYERKQ